MKPHLPGCCGPESVAPTPGAPSRVLRLEPWPSAVPLCLFLRRASVLLARCYAVGVGLWAIAHAAIGDAVWWLALINSFVPVLFVPLPLLNLSCHFFRCRSLRTVALIPILTFVLLYGPLFLPRFPTRPAPTEDRLSVVTFNLWTFSQSGDTARAVLQRGTPDVVALQELGSSASELSLTALV